MAMTIICVRITRFCTKFGLIADGELPKTSPVICGYVQGFSYPGIMLFHIQCVLYLYRFLYVYFLQPPLPRAALRNSNVAMAVVSTRVGDVMGKMIARTAATRSSVPSMVSMGLTH